MSEDEIDALRHAAHWVSMDALSACNAVTRLLSHIDALTRERDAAVLAEREACGAAVQFLRRMQPFGARDHGFNDGIDAAMETIWGRSTSAPVQP